MAGVQKLQVEPGEDGIGIIRVGSFLPSQKPPASGRRYAAQDLETHHRKMALGVLPRPNLTAQTARPIADVIAEYLQWGPSREGLVVGPGVPSTTQSARQLRWWYLTSRSRRWLIATTASRLSSRRVAGLSQAGRSGKTLVSYRESQRVLFVVCGAPLSRDASPPNGAH